MKIILTTHMLLLGMLLTGGLSAAQTTTPAPTTPAPATTPTAPATTPATTTPASTAVTATPVDPKSIVARIGSEEVTLEQFDAAFRNAVARLVNGQGMPFSEDILAEFAGARGDYLKQLVRDRAVNQLAAKNAKVDAAAVDAQLADIRKRFQSDDEFKSALQQSGYASEAELRASIERQQILNAYLDKLKSGFKFGDAFVNTYYTAHRADFTRDAEACVKHILVPTEAEAKDIAKSLAAGGDFAKLAQEKSKDPGSAAQGGDLGCFGQGEMVPEFDKASFSGPLNAVQTVQSQFGWHVLTVTKRTQAGLMPLTEAAPLIRDQLAREAAQKYLDSQVAKIKTETFPELVQVTQTK